MLSHHKHLLASTSCPGGENDGAAVRRHVLLVGRYQTDFVEIKFYDKDNNLVEDTETLYSLGVILSRKLTELLGVNDGEIEFGYDGINHSISYMILLSVVQVIHCSSENIKMKS